jgi:hypothetical protein
MTPLSVSVSDVIYVDFGKKEVIARQILQFDKIELLREGLIDYKRLVKRGHPVIVAEAS